MLKRRPPEMFAVWGMLIVLGFNSPAVAAVETELARDGEPTMPVVIHEDAGEVIRDAADDLIDHLDRITGGAFELERAEALPETGIVLGTIEQFPVDDLAEALEMRGAFDGREAYAVRTQPGRVLLLGGGELGASHAAFAILEHLGCRWFFPSESWRIVPEKPTLTVAMDEHDRPALLGRRIWWGHGLFSREARADYERWSRRNRMASSLRVRASHAYQTIIRENQELIDEHPEYLALVDGERTGPQLCLTESGAQQMVVDHVLGRFERDPDRDMVSVDPSDGGGHCECEDCQAKGKVSNRVFNMANIAARAVQEHHPGKMVGLYAYSMHSEPPDFDLEPNVYVQLTAGFIRGQYTFDELVELWPKRVESMGFYEYFSVYLWDWDKLPGGRAADVRDVRDRIRRYVDAGATSLDAESGNNWGVHGRGYYVANRLMWDPEADLDELLDDFYTGAFGPAAEVMQRYYERLDPGNDPLVSEDLLARAFGDIAEAWELASGHPGVRDRLEELIWYLHFVHLRWIYDRSDDEAERKETVLDLLTHVYRSRYAYMNHWAAIRNWHTRRWSDEFDEPSWNWRQRDEPHPWAVDEDYTRDETLAMLEKGLEAFEPEDIEQVTFSDDLVPVDFEHAVSRGTNHRYQGGVRYALYSIAGEPIELALTAGRIAHYRNRPDARYTFFDAEDQSIEEGFLPLDGEAHDVTFEVPGPGIYFFEIADSSAGWRIEAEPGVIATIPLQRASGFRHAGHMSGGLYFYVPRGVERLTYYWSGLPHRVHDPDGEIVKEVEASDRFIEVPVPENADGRIWRFSRIRLGHMWFFNLPNYVAGSPDALLLPREVAEADDLNVRE